MASYSEEVLDCCINCEQYESLLQKSTNALEEREIEMQNMKNIIKVLREENEEKVEIMNRLGIGMREIRSIVSNKDKNSYSI